MPLDWSYVPIIKSTDAELRGYENLSENVKTSVLPVFELTKSRRSKLNPHGDITRRVEQIRDVVGGRPFVLDLTAHEDLMNYQIEDLLDEDDGFDAWCSFVEKLSPETAIIPVVHAYEDGDLAEVAAAAKRLEKACGKVAFRADAFDDDTNVYIEAIYRGITSRDNLIVVIDCGYVDAASRSSIASDAVARLQQLAAIGFPGGVAVAGSSFPVSPAMHPEGQDDAGELPMEEVFLFDEVLASFPDVSVAYGDYAAIHPIRYQTRGGSWVPRVDVSLEDSYIYHRYRRNDGGYVRAANAMVNDEKYEPIGCWGDEQIELAASGEPSGLSPAFWISVRLNIHVTKRVVGR